MDTPRKHNKKSNTDPATPPSAKSARNDTTASSNDDTVATAVTTLTEGSGRASILGPLLPPAEGGEGEEEEEVLDQEGLPEEIKNARYIVEEGQRKLDEDIKKFELEDCNIDLNDEGIAHFRMAPTDMHQAAVEAINDLVYISLYTHQGSAVIVDDAGHTKDPDLAVWGEERLRKNFLGKLLPTDKEVVGIGNEKEWRVNPHVIVEFSCSHGLEKKEVPKFAQQMDDHIEALGQINYGVLIKTISTKPGQYSTNHNPGAIPMCGFDIYVAGPGEGRNVTKAKPSMEYRVGGRDVDLVVPGDARGESNYQNISFSVRVIQQVLEERGVVFEKVGKAD